MKMKWVLKIRSKLNPVMENPTDVVFGTYSYCSADQGVKLILRCKDTYNNAVTKKEPKYEAYTITVDVVSCEQEDAKLKVKGAKVAVNAFKNYLYQKTDLTKYFEVI